MKKYLWKILKAGLQSGHADFKWKKGKWYKIEGELEMCSNGFHASKLILDAMSFVNLECLAKVDVKGKSEKQDDKQCWSEMRIVKAWHWKKQDSVALAIYSAELVIDLFEKEYPEDDRPRKAIEAAKKYLQNPTEENKSAARSAASVARSAAWSAARSVAWSAAESAESAARSAARSAAESAARSARSAAWSAARSAALKKTKAKIEKWIINHIKELEEIK